MTTESTMFADLLAVQMEMPKLQKSAINPHFKNKYVPLEDLLDAVVPILNAHNFVLLQMPDMTATGEGALSYELLHVSGSKIGSTMALMAAKDDPQGQGSAITYARRYSLMSLLGITADLDDDAEATRKVPPMARAAVARGDARPAERPVAEQDLPLPECPQGHGSMKYWPAGKVSAQYKCMNKGCKNDAGWPESIWADKWLTQVNLARGGNEPAFAGVDPDEDLPFE